MTPATPPGPPARPDLEELGETTREALDLRVGTVHDFQGFERGREGELVIEIGRLLGSG